MIDVQINGIILKLLKYRFLKTNSMDIRFMLEDFSFIKKSFNICFEIPEISTISSLFNICFKYNLISHVSSLLGDIVKVAHHYV